MIDKNLYTGSYFYLYKFLSAANWYANRKRIAETDTNCVQAPFPFSFVKGKGPFPVSLCRCLLLLRPIYEREERSVFFMSPLPSLFYFFLWKSCRLTKQAEMGEGEWVRNSCAAGTLHLLVIAIRRTPLLSFAGQSLLYLVSHKNWSATPHSLSGKELMIPLISYSPVP